MTFPLYIYVDGDYCNWICFDERKKRNQKNKLCEPKLIILFEGGVREKLKG